MTTTTDPIRQAIATLRQSLTDLDRAVAAKLRTAESLDAPPELRRRAPTDGGDAVTNIRVLIEAILLEHVAADHRDAAREDLFVLVNCAELSARRDEIERGLEAAAAREDEAREEARR